MRQLSGMDAAFLNMETRSTFGHVSSLNLFDVSGLGRRRLLRGHPTPRRGAPRAAAPFRRRLVEVPLGLDLPYWIEDPDFDLDFHVRHHAVPPPGTPQQLSDVISRIHARPLDRTRPLWELYVIDGVDDGRMAATFTKVHHATIDGASGAMMLAALLDVDQQGRPTPEPVPWQPEAVPSDRQLLERTMLEYLRRPEKFVRLSVRALRELSAATRNGGLRVMADLLAQPVPGPVGDFMRRRLRGTDNEVDNPPALPVDGGPTHAVERLDRRAPPLRLHDGAAGRRQERAPRRRVHVQRRRDGAVLGHAAPLPGEARLPARRAADRHGAGQRAHRRRGGHATRTGCRRCSPTWPRTSPTTAAASTAAEGDDGPGEDGLPGHPGRHAAGLHPVRPAGDRRPGDAHVQPAAHRRPHGAAVQPGHLQRARTELPAVRRRRRAQALLPGVGDRRRRRASTSPCRATTATSTSASSATATSSPTSG